MKDDKTSNAPMARSLTTLILVVWTFAALAQAEGNSFDAGRNEKSSDISPAQNSTNRQVAGSTHAVGGYGALMISGTAYRKKTIPIISLRCALLVNGRMAYGIEYHTIIPLQDYEILMPPEPKRNLSAKMSGSYAGVFVEPIIYSSRTIHVTFPVAIGGGVLKYSRSWTQEAGWDYAGLVDMDHFWYLQPGMQVEIDLNAITRTGLGVSYRVANNLTLMDTSKGAFSGFCLSYYLKLGLF